MFNGYSDANMHMRIDYLEDAFVVVQYADIPISPEGNFPLSAC